MPGTSAKSFVMQALQSRCRGPTEIELCCLQGVATDRGQLGRQQQVGPCGDGTAWGQYALLMPDAETAQT